MKKTSDSCHGAARTRRHEQRFVDMRVTPRRCPVAAKAAVINSPFASPHQPVATTLGHSLPGPYPYTPALLCHRTFLYLLSTTIQHLRWSPSKPAFPFPASCALRRSAWAVLQARPLYTSEPRTQPRACLPVSSSPQPRRAQVTGHTSTGAAPTGRGSRLSRASQRLNPSVQGGRQGNPAEPPAQATSVVGRTPANARTPCCCLHLAEGKPPGGLSSSVAASPLASNIGCLACCFPSAPCWALTPRRSPPGPPTPLYIHRTCHKAPILQELHRKPPRSPPDTPAPPPQEAAPSPQSKTSPPIPHHPCLPPIIPFPPPQAASLPGLPMSKSPESISKILPTHHQTPPPHPAYLHLKRPSPPPAGGLDDLEGAGPAGGPSFCFPLSVTSFLPGAQTATSSSVPQRHSLPQSLPSDLEPERRSALSNAMASSTPQERAEEPPQHPPKSSASLTQSRKGLGVASTMASSIPKRQRAGESPPPASCSPSLITGSPTGEAPPPQPKAHRPPPPRPGHSSPASTRVGPSASLLRQLPGSPSPSPLEAPQHPAMPCGPNVPLSLLASCVVVPCHPSIQPPAPSSLSHCPPSTELQPPSCPLCQSPSPRAAPASDQPRSGRLPKSTNEALPLIENRSWAPTSPSTAPHPERSLHLPPNDVSFVALSSTSGIVLWLTG
ncbi:extensin-like [Alosa alosa]|uniref:extensin-like n=1 Tax=Alosa alosa TaxID=278164 RepID=UPI002015348E|nr:extensin-like [Alosa alosa]